MIKPDIILISNRNDIRLAPLRADMDGYTMGYRVVTTGKDASAALNRNYGLDQSSSPVVVMIDDDISGFYEGWVSDLVTPLLDESVMFVGARLMNSDGSCAGMMFGSNNLNIHVEDVVAVPTACCAFKNTGHRFEERFLGSGFEDTLYCLQLRQMFPEHRIVINNRCKLIHKNVQQNQHGAFYDHNFAIYKELTEGMDIPQPSPQGLRLPEEIKFQEPKSDRLVIR